MTCLLIGTHIINRLYLSSLRNHEHRELQECDEYDDRYTRLSRAMYGGRVWESSAVGFPLCRYYRAPDEGRMWSFALRRPARDWRFGSQRCETGRCASSVRD